jgi:hypothetical protein
MASPGTPASFEVASVRPTNQITGIHLVEGAESVKSDESACLQGPGRKESKTAPTPDIAAPTDAIVKNR